MSGCRGEGDLHDSDESLKWIGIQPRHHVIEGGRMWKKSIGYIQFQPTNGDGKCCACAFIPGGYV